MYVCVYVCMYVCMYVMLHVRMYRSSRPSLMFIRSSIGKAA